MAWRLGSRVHTPWNLVLASKRSPISSPHDLFVSFLLQSHFQVAATSTTRGNSNQLSPQLQFLFSLGRGLVGFSIWCFWCFVEGFSIMRAREADTHGTAVRFPVMVHTVFPPRITLIVLFACSKRALLFHSYFVR